MRATKMTRTTKQWSWSAALLTGLSLAAACSPAAPGSQPESPPVSQYSAAVFGQDGAFSVPAATNAIVNRYAALTQNAAAGTNLLTVNNVAAFNVAAGDLLLVIQMQGAEIDSSDTILYGAVTNLRGAGQYEYVTVAAVNAGMNQIRIDSCGGGLRNSYLASAHTQVVRVPQYTTLTVPAGSSIVAPAWNGQVGGIVAVHALTSVALAGTIDASARGFRGGTLEQTTDYNIAIFRSANSTDGAEKGESIAGYQTEYDALGGRFGRGAPANGGGGGNAHNCGGGGGANAGDPAAWRRGQGVMDGNAMGGAMAWPLDPEYLTNMNKLTTDAGGGRGGYSFSNTDLNALTQGPGLTTWGGDSRYEHGGLGGHPLAQNVAQRLFFGGGGGAGDSNNDQGGIGGIGGGIVLVTAPAVTGVGQILANGGNGANTAGGGNNDAPGGGGGGGTIVVTTASLATTIALRANGGTGGNQLAIGPEAEGPGGGGGGGIIAYSGGAATRQALGGANGTTASTALTEFPANGSTRGNVGAPDVSSAALGLVFPATICPTGNADLAVAITDNIGAGGVTPGGNVVYTVTVNNRAGVPVMGATLSNNLPNGVGTISWTCAGNGGATCPAASGMGSIGGGVNLPVGGSLVYTVTVAVPAAAMGLLSYGAAIATPPGIVDPNLTNNAAVDVDLIVSGSPTASDLSVAVSHMPDPVTPGANATYTLQVNNAGPGPVNTTLVSFTLPPGGTLAGPAMGSGWTCQPTGGSVSCVLASLAVGMAPAITVPVTIPAAPTSPVLPASATVSASNNTDPMPLNNTAVDNANIAFTDIAVSVSDNKTGANLKVGDVVTYTVTVSNLGNVRANMVNLTEIFNPAATPSAWTCMGVGGGTCPMQSGTGLINSNGVALPVGASVVYQVTVTVPATMLPTFLHTVTGTAIGAADINLSNNTGADLHIVDLAAVPMTNGDLALKITHTPDRAAPGSDVTFTAQVTNLGGSPVGPTVVSFTLPAGSVIKTPAAGTGWMCQTVNLTVACGRASADPGDAPPITVVITVPDSNLGTPAITGTVGASGNTDPNPVNNDAVDVVPPPQADLAVTVDKSPPAAGPGEETTYTITATNNGPDPASRPVVTFAIPPGATVTMPAAGDTWTCTQPGEVFICTRPDLPQGSAPPIVVKVTTPTSGPAPAVTQITAPVSDPNPGNNRVITDGNPASSADVSIKITRDIDPAALGQIVTYTAQVDNAGPDAAPAPVVTLQVPPGVQIVQPAQGSNWACSQAGSTFTCVHGTLAVGSAEPITMKLVTPAPPSGNQSGNRGALTGVVETAAATDPNLANNLAAVDVGGLPTTAVDLDIRLTRTPEVAEPGTIVTLQIDVTNKGTGTANDVSTFIALPPGLEIVQPAMGDGWTCTASAQGYLCTRPQLAEGPAPPITVKLKAPPVDNQDPAVVATVTSVRNSDPNPADNITSTGVSGIKFRLAGGGFSCSMATGPSSSAASAGLFALLGALALLRRRRLRA